MFPFPEGSRPSRTSTSTHRHAVQRRAPLGSTCPLRGAPRVHLTPAREHRQLSPRHSQGTGPAHPPGSRQVLPASVGVSVVSVSPAAKSSGHDHDYQPDRSTTSTGTHQVISGSTTPMTTDSSVPLPMGSARAPLPPESHTSYLGCCRGSYQTRRLLGLACWAAARWISPTQISHHDAQGPRHFPQTVPFPLHT